MTLPTNLPAITKAFGFKDKDDLEVFVLQPSFLEIWAEFRDDFLWDPETTSTKENARAPNWDLLTNTILKELKLGTASAYSVSHGVVNKAKYSAIDHYVRLHFQAIEALLHEWTPREGDIEDIVKGMVGLTTLLRQSYKRKALNSALTQKVQARAPISKHTEEAKGFDESIRSTPMDDSVRMTSGATTLASSSSSARAFPRPRSQHDSRKSGNELPEIELVQRLRDIDSPTSKRTLPDVNSPGRSHSSGPDEPQAFKAPRLLPPQQDMRPQGMATLSPEHQMVVDMSRLAARGYREAKELHLEHVRASEAAQESMAKWNMEYTSCRQRLRTLGTIPADLNSAILKYIADG